MTTPISSNRSTRRFIRHYAEMVAVMFTGMIVLGLPAGWLFGALGTSWSDLAPEAMLFVMGVTMTVPMVAWMSYRGHTWRANLEMAASMIVPTFAAMGLAASGAVGGGGPAMVIQHVAMLACMLIAMLARRDEYSGHVHSTPAQAVAG